MYVGTCGYAYKDWIGPFYPATIRAGEMLPYYAQCFPAVEIDSSYYGVLPPQTIARMDRVTPAEFRFCFKAPATVTHPPDPSQRVHSDAAAFAESVTPFSENRKLGAVLLQFPNGLRNTASAVDYVRRVIEALAGLPLVAEFRNSEWQEPRTQDLLRQLHAGWCNVDMPSYQTLMRPSSDATSRIGYVRFHGRNAKQWWTGSNVTRYDYEYSAEELEPWTNRVAEIEDAAETTYAFFNNHARGQSARNAELFIELLRSRFGGRADVVARRAGVPAQKSLF